ncbi:ATP-binding protein [Phenylobacterium sp. J367]|uniref:ATP-binding protein n=1 Tax=Phenylobacterium sp. J367 TaxID=2898435 RepID=UPI0027E26ACA|nr:ATP-binding protein [Phenylobacterium sp. J367]
MTIPAFSFEERIGIMADREAAEFDSKRLTARLKFAALRQDACVEDLDLKTPRGLDRALLARLVAGDWIGRHQQNDRHVLLTTAGGVPQVLDDVEANLPKGPGRPLGHGQLRTEKIPLRAWLEKRRRWHVHLTHKAPPGSIRSNRSSPC